VKRHKHVLGERPAQAPPGMAGRWLIAGTLVTERYPRYVPRKRGGASADPNARVGELAPCEVCGNLALMRHPGTGRPCHKGCVNAKATTRTVAPAEVIWDDVDPDTDPAEDGGTDDG